MCLKRQFGVQGDVAICSLDGKYGHFDTTSKCPRTKDKNKDIIDTSF